MPIARSCLAGALPVSLFAPNGPRASTPFGMNPTDSSAPFGARQAEDGELLRRMARGDKAACSDLYDRFSKPLYSVAVRILSDTAEAEDVIQDVFLTLWEKAAGFDASRGSAFAWAITLTRNRAIDRLRTRNRRATLIGDAFTADLAPAGDTPDSDSAGDLMLKEKTSAVRAALATLPGDQAHALELAFFSGLTQQEIATRLAEPLGTVKARIRRGLLKLRDALALRHD